MQEYNLTGTKRRYSKKVGFCHGLLVGVCRFSRSSGECIGVCMYIYIYVWRSIWGAKNSNLVTYIYIYIYISLFKRT